RGRPNAMKNPASNTGGNISGAVESALGFFARKQHQDGYWKETSSPIAHTGLVVLSYLSYGVTHKSAIHKDTELYMENVERALDWLVVQVGPNGALRDGGRMYDQAAGTYALAEAYMVTKDERLKEPLQRAVNWLVDSQHEAGGWRYNRNMPGDLSVSGWVISALVSASNAGIAVPDEIFKKAGAFVLAQHSSDGKYGYIGKGFTLTMSSAGMFCLQLLGKEIMGPIVAGSGFNGGGGGGQQNNNALYKDLIEKSSVVLGQNLPNAKAPKSPRPYYYWYYGTFAMRILGGEPWEKWKSSMHNTLLPMQVKDGSGNDGSWNPKQTSTGRIVTTAWVVLTVMAPDRPSLGQGGAIYVRPRGERP
ncbi:MAG: terpene cyclase/mutase family protein, partial [Verrucomicrobiota bacterium]|nr:terpene cyclase/mutase family protein [Verrucomicrobiota bacterium]